jgi:hypothetical protein
MAQDEASDSKIVDRLKNQPPFPEETPEEPPAEPQPEPETPPEAPVEPVEETKPPEETEDEQKKRTQEQFEKLKEHNAELKRQLDEAKTPKKNALDALIPENPPPSTTNVIPTPQQYPTLSPKEIKDTFAGLIDENGYVDTGLLKETLVGLQRAKEEAEKRVVEAETRVKNVERKQADFERKQIMKEVHAVYPRLDPENAGSEEPDKKFSQTFYDLFQGEIMHQWSTVGTADPMKVAEKVSGILYGQGMTKADKEKAEKAELAKKNINATSVKPASTHETYKDKDELIKATQQGKRGALAERLARSGY